MDLDVEQFDPVDWRFSLMSSTDGLCEGAPAAHRAVVLALCYFLSPPMNLRVMNKSYKLIMYADDWL